MTPEEQAGFIPEYERDYFPDFDDLDESIGSCDNCGVNVYEDEDDGSGLCGQCQWFASINCSEQRASE